MKKASFVDFIHKLETNSRESVQLTSIITNRTLNFGINGSPDFNDEIMILDKIFSPLQPNTQMQKGLDAMKIFLPRVPYELFNRYSAIKRELKLLEEQGIETLVIGACGLSPLGLVFAQNPDLKVYDTDLEEIVFYRKGLELKNSNYSLVPLDLLDKEQVEKFASSLPKGKSAMVVEGLTFYFDEEQREKLHNNLKLISKYQPSITFIFDYFVSDQPARKRDTVRDENNPAWSDFQQLIKNVHSEQKCFFKTRNDVIKYLVSEGFEDIKISEFSDKSNAHTIFVARY